MTMITIYDSDGFYTQSYDLPSGDTPTVPIGGGYTVGDYDGAQYYHLSGTPTERPSLTDEEYFEVHADGTDTLTINLVNGTIVTDNETYTVYTSVGSETFQFRSAITGEWKFLLEPPFPYKSTEITVTANAY